MNYLYCVIPDNKPQSFDCQGIGGPLYTIPYNDISLVVSDCQPIPFSSLGKEELLNYLLKHQSAIESIMQKYSVIPLKFGTFLEKESAQKVIQKEYKAFKDIFNFLNGKIELEVVALWNNLDEIFKKIGEIAEIKKLKEGINLFEEKTNARIVLGKMVKQALDEKKVKLSEEITNALLPHALSFCRHPVLNDSMICNLAFLIEKNRKEEFENCLSSLDQQLGNLNFKLVGPLPPYSFATFEVKRLTLEEVIYSRRLLGTDEDPSPSQVKEAYHFMAQKFHPDKNPNQVQAIQQFEEIKKAYEILNNYCQNGRDLTYIRRCHEFN